ncbi:heavy metal translocating P-type ATPase [Selenomonas ruminis]|uniref:Cd(2+)-exporting ATPase n=1 Tax=Selenomonas ruminis TaxID=2593411 RepID=A0A5D6W547_9FIRM|nr:heavy metal translocating P-type ATPase [Selenomonas sp. mPRGC5]TYZ21974.1 cadmium-translocating P-type ATPase [Selenomonas sp. mPRGC5]
MDKKKRNLVRIIAAAVMLAVLAYAPLAGGWRFAAYLVPYLVVGYDVLLKAAKGVKNRKAFDESLLMAIATIGAMALAVYEDGDYTEGIAVMLFYQVGEWFQSYAVGRSRRDISELMDIRPDYANIEKENGQLEKVDPEEVQPGTIIVVQPGEKIPLDGVVTMGQSSLDTVALTGESLPRDVNPGDEVLSGCINKNGLLRIRTTREFEESTASKILELVEEASSNKSRSEAFITRFARVYTPVVVYAAIALALLPPLWQLFLLGGAPQWGMWFYRALTFLVISCPCALVISIPLSFFAGLGGASRQGVLIKGSNYLEALASVDTVVFDKTGTLTKGVFEVTAVHPEKMDEKQLLHLAAHVERFSTHPIAASLKAAYRNEADDCAVEDIEEIAGHGVRARVNDHKISVGNSRMMEAEGISWHDCTHTGTIIHVAMDGEYAGHIVISDVVKEDSAKAVEALHRNGVAEVFMLTGDAEKVAAEVAGKLGIDKVYSELLPADKVTKVEELLAAKQAAGSQGKLAFVGDGINDAPVISRADVGIAMGAMGSDAAIEAADVVLMDDNPLQLAKAQRLARKTMRIVRQNIRGSIGIKVIVLVLGAVGLANMWAAIFADVGVMVLAVLNAMRAMMVPRNNVKEVSGRKESDMKKTYKIDVDCPNCANLMEEAANKTPGVKMATINFMLLKMKVEFEDGYDAKSVMEEVRLNCKKVEDDCEIYL